MLDKEKLLKNLNEDIKTLEHKIKYRKLYNIKNYIIKFLLKSGIALEYALPFLFCAIIIFNIQTRFGDTPFIIDEIVETSKTETIFNSNGDNIENIYYSKNHIKTEIILEYSTKWEKNTIGLYERIISFYKLDREIDLTNIDSILSMSKDEIDSLFKYTSSEIITKKNLDKKDSLYMEDVLILTITKENFNDIKVRNQTDEENVRCMLIYLFLVFISGLGLFNIKNIFLKDIFKDKLKKEEVKFSIITKEDFEKLNKILKLKKENLLLLKEDNSKTYKLQRGNYE